MFIEQVSNDADLVPIDSQKGQIVAIQMCKMIELLLQQRRTMQVQFLVRCIVNDLELAVMALQDVAK